MDREQAKALLIAVEDWKIEAIEFIPNNGPFHSDPDINGLGRATDALSYLCDSGIVSIDPTPLIEFHEACYRLLGKSWKQIDDGQPSDDALRHLYDQAFRVAMRMEKLAWRNFSEMFVGPDTPTPPADASSPTLSPDKTIHSADFSSVVWFGQPFTFTPSQAACVKVLWLAWEQGTPILLMEYVREEVEVHSEMRHVFRDHPAWGTMIRKTSRKHFCLCPPGSDNFDDS